MNEYLGDILIFLGVCFVLFLLVIAAMLVAVAWLGKKWLDRLVIADPEVLHKRLDKLRAKTPELSSEELVRKIVHREALKCGVVGFITGFGGLPLLPVMVPLDIAASLRIQATMVNFIAQVYGREPRSSQGLKMQTYLIMTGSEQVVSVSSRLLRELLLKAATRSFVKLVPLIGGVAGFAANWFTTQAMGRTAVRWYNGDLQTLPDKVSQLLGRGAGDAEQESEEQAS